MMVALVMVAVVMVAVLMMVVVMVAVLNVAWVVLHCNRRIGARERRQLIPHVRFQVPFLGPESQLKSGFACAGLPCSNSICLLLN